MFLVFQCVWFSYFWFYIVQCAWFDSVLGFQYFNVFGFQCCLFFVWLGMSFYLGSFCLTHVGDGGNINPLVFAESAFCFLYCNVFACVLSWRDALKNE